MNACSPSSGQRSGSGEVSNARTQRDSFLRAISSNIHAASLPVKSDHWGMFFPKRSQHRKAITLLTRKEEQRRAIRPFFSLHFMKYFCNSHGSKNMRADRMFRAASFASLRLSASRKNCGRSHRTSRKEGCMHLI